jgi:hypothetical protein
VTPLALTAATVCLAAAAIITAKLAQPALLHRKALRLDRQVRAAKRQQIRINVAGQLAADGDAWQRFLASHEELRPDRHGGI